MAAKLILSMDGMVLQEYALNKGRMTIGRKPHNDIPIDNLAVSGEHAAIITILNDSFLEDLDSTNGVMVNGTQVKKHFLQHNDLIEIGKYKLKYISEQSGQVAAADDFEKTMVLRAPVKPLQASAPKASNDAPMRAQTNLSPSATPPQTDSPQAVAGANQTVYAAALQVLNGPGAGRDFNLVKNLTSLGKPGVQVAVLTRRPHGYFITHVEGANYPTLNGKVLNDQPHKLKDHDIIELAGVKMEFYFKN